MDIIKIKELNFSEKEHLWRYLCLHKFLSFIIEKKLFFTRLDKFDDPLEGLTEETIAHIAAYEIEKDVHFDIPDENKQEQKKNEEQRKRIISEQTTLTQTTLYANCWFISQKESMAMWNLYSDPDSVAIRFEPNTLISNIITSAKSSQNNDFKKMIYGKVEYEDIWPFDFINEKDYKIKYTPFKKDNSYLHENEFRFTVAVPTDAAGRHEYFELPLDLNMDFKIFAHPRMSEWKFQNLKKLLEYFDLSDNLVKSDLRVNL